MIFASEVFFIQTKIVNFVKQLCFLLIGRPKASVACSTNATAHAWFNTSSLTALACEVTIRSVVTKVIADAYSRRRQKVRKFDHPQ